MKQKTLAMAADQGAGFEQHRRPTRRDEFLDTMNRIVPWAELCAVIEPHYPKRGNGRPPIGLERMLRIHFIQHWFNPADFACEEALCDMASLRKFASIDLGCESNRYRMLRRYSHSDACSRNTISMRSCLPKSDACCKAAA